MNNNYASKNWTRLKRKEIKEAIKKGGCPANNSKCLCLAEGKCTFNKPRLALNAGKICCESMERHPPSEKTGIKTCVSYSLRVLDKGEGLARVRFFLMIFEQRGKSNSAKMLKLKIRLYPLKFL